MTLPVAAFLGPAISYDKVYLFHLIGCLFLGYFSLNLKSFDYSIVLQKKNYLFLTAPIYFLISFLWANNLTQAIKFEIILLIGLVCYFGVNLLVENKYQFQKIIKYLGILFCVHLLVSLLEAFTKFRLPISPVSPFIKSLRSAQWVQEMSYPSFYEHYPTSFFWHPNNVALVTLCSLPIIFQSRLKFYFKILIWFISLIVIMKAGAKAILIFFAIYSFFSLIKSTKHLKNYKKFILPLGLTVCLSGIVTWGSLHKAQKMEMKQSIVTFSRYASILPKFLMNEFFNTNFDLDFHSNTSERFTFMGAAIQEYKKSPILGLGAGQLYNRQVSWKGQEVNVRSIHNYWLEMLVLGGPLYILCYIVWFIYIVFKLTHSKNTLSKAFGESMIIFFFAAPVLSSAFYFLPKWLLYGLATKSLDIESSPKEDNS